MLQLIIQSTRNAAAVEEFPQPQSFAGNGDIENSLMGKHERTIGVQAAGCQTDQIIFYAHRKVEPRRADAF
jgi:hypothetical protein